MTLRIVAVYPDLLGTYGDTGNAEVLLKRCIWRGIDATWTLAPSNEPLPEGDLYCLGGGEDGPQVLAAERLIEDGTLLASSQQGGVIFAVCAGFQIIGNQFPDSSGALHQGVGLLDVTTKKGSGKRHVGEVVVQVPSESEGGLGLGLLSGFENHSGITELGATTRSLGPVLRGSGNGFGDRVEGAYADNVVGTYLHGPVLARNPALADLLLKRALRVDELVELDDTREERLRQERMSEII